MSARTHYCVGSVWNGYRSQGCGNRAKALVEGRWYCGIHDPVAVAAKRDARAAKWRAEEDARQARFAAQRQAADETARRAAAYDELVCACRASLDCIEKHVPNTVFAPREMLRAVLAKVSP